jgi:hypothetical protein
LNRASEGQSKNQIVTDGRIADGPRLLRYALHVFEGLKAVNGALYPGVILLHAKTNAPKAKVVQHLQVLMGRIIGVTFQP